MRESAPAGCPSPQSRRSHLPGSRKRPMAQPRMAHEARRRCPSGLRMRGGGALRCRTGRRGVPSKHVRASNPHLCSLPRDRRRRGEPRRHHYAPETRLAAVAATLACHAFHAALILAPEGGRALVITDLDLIRAAGAPISTGPPRTPRASRSRRSPGAPLEDAVALMARQDLAHLLVDEPGSAWPSGVLSSFDVRAVLGGRDPALTRSIRRVPRVRS
jgi:hypothetical protein